MASARFASVEEDYIATLLSNKDRENAKKASIDAVGVVQFEKSQPTQSLRNQTGSPILPIQI